MTFKIRQENPILIFECANAHGGDLDVLLKTIISFSSVKYNKKHIKFQPFHPETISLDDFSWHKIYHQLKFKDTEWEKIIELASNNYNGVWLDLFDLFGVEILKENFNIAAYKGKPVSFRNWNRQLRQPILLVTPRALVSVSPQNGFVHPRTELDTLGIDEPDTKCKLN